MDLQVYHNHVACRMPEAKKIYIFNLTKQSMIKNPEVTWRRIICQHRIKIYDNSTDHDRSSKKIYATTVFQHPGTRLNAVPQHLDKCRNKECAEHDNVLFSTCNQ